MSKILIIFVIALIFVFLVVLVPIIIDYYYKSFTPIYINRELNKSIINSRNVTPTNIYYINLEKSANRRVRFINHLDNTMTPIRIDAVSPKTLPTITKAFKCMTTMKTEDACIASHIKAMYTAYHKGEQWAIIAEDDAMIVKNIDWRRLIHSAPPEWDVLQMHTCCLSGLASKELREYILNDSILWVHTKSVLPSTALYIISRQGMEKILSQLVVGYQQPIWDNITKLDFTSAEVNCQADLLLFDIVDRYLCAYPLIDIHEDDSTISWTHTNYNSYDCYRL